jgi:hypothetical protein
MIFQLFIGGSPLMRAAIAPASGSGGLKKTRRRGALAAWRGPTSHRSQEQAIVLHVLVARQISFYWGLT